MMRRRRRMMRRRRRRCRRMTRRTRIMRKKRKMRRGKRRTRTGQRMVWFFAPRLVGALLWWVRATVLCEEGEGEEEDDEYE
jgi:hypothetical protein